MFPGAGAQIYRNEAGEVIGWDNPSDDDPFEPDDNDRDNDEYDQLTCRECGAEMWLDASGVSHHWGETIDDIDHDADADHVAVSEEEY